VSATPFRVIVISVEHIDHLPDVPIISRSFLPKESNPHIRALDELSLDTDFWTQGWGENLLQRLQDAAIENTVAYAVPGHPMLGDATIHFLIQQDSAGLLDLELFDEPLPVVLTELLASGGKTPAFVDVLTLFEEDRESPFSAGTLPVNSSQTTVITNLVPGVAGEDIQRIVSRRFRPETEVRLIPMIGAPEQAMIRLDQLTNEASGFPCYLVVPPVKEDEFQRSTDDLQRLVARLRGPGGCPWDQEQTNVSLGRNLIEESYELLDAIESGNPRAMREELGDFLLQALLHAQIAEESGTFHFEDVISSVVDKLVRRHPHVFAQGDADTSEHVVQTWDEIKRAERAARPDEKPASTLGDIPVALPALMRAQSIIKRSGRTELSVDEIEALSGSAYAYLETDDERETVAHILQSVQDAQEKGVDSEQALRNWTLAFERALEKLAKSDSSAR
jgi:tetrapyrrole methylase family protein / MazG family protein